LPSGIPLAAAGRADIAATATPASRLSEIAKKPALFYLLLACLG
jgi:hypothetical protein